MPIVIDKLINVCGELQLVFSCGKCGFESVEELHCMKCDRCEDCCKCIDYSQNQVRLILQGKDTLGNTNPDGWLNTYLLNRNNSDLPASWMGYVLQNEVDLPQLPHEKTMKSSEFYDYIMNVISEAGYDLSCQDHGAGGYFQHEPTLQISLGYVIVNQWVGYDR